MFPLKEKVLYTTCIIWERKCSYGKRTEAHWNEQEHPKGKSHSQIICMITSLMNLHEKDCTLHRHTFAEGISSKYFSLLDPNLNETTK